MWRETLEDRYDYIAMDRTFSVTESAIAEPVRTDHYWRDSIIGIQSPLGLGRQNELDTKR